MPPKLGAPLVKTGAGSCRAHRQRSGTGYSRSRLLSGCHDLAVGKNVMFFNAESPCA